MQPNINLLKDLPTQTVSKYLTPTFLKLVSIGFIIFLLVIYFINLGLYSKAQRNLKNLEATQALVTKQTLLLQKQIQLNAALPSGMANDFNTAIPKFSLYLKKFALYTPYGIWLTNININQLNETFSISGQAIKSSVVLEFIKNITQYNILNDHHLGNIKLKKNEKDNIISFSLNNTIINTIKSANKQ